MKRRSLLRAVASLPLLGATGVPRAQSKPRVLLVATSHADGPGGRLTGVWLPELTDAYWIFRDDGCSVDFGTIRGEAPPIDPRSGSDRTLPMRLKNDDAALKAFNDAVCLDCVDGRRYAAVFLAGGHGALWDFPESASLRALVEHVVVSRKPLGAVSQGPAALLGARLDDRPLAGGRRLACFTDAEVERDYWAAHVPYSLQQRLEADGASVQHGPVQQPHVVRDGALVTGQNARSAASVARQVLDALRRS